MKSNRELLGAFEEKEIDELLGGNNVSGGTTPATPSSIPCIEVGIKIVTVIGGAIAATLNFDACPTSACTKSCTNYC